MKVYSKLLRLSKFDLISLGDDISLNITSTNNKVIDSINYFLNNIKIKNQIKLNNNKVGENLAKVDIYSNGKKYH